MITASYHAKEGHIGSALSVLDILYVLYDKVLNITFNNLHSPNRDYLILSKGHASLAHAVILEFKKFISELFKAKIHEIYFTCSMPLN